MATLSVNSLLLAVESGHYPEWSNRPETRAIIKDEMYLFSGVIS